MVGRESLGRPQGFFEGLRRVVYNDRHERVIGKAKIVCLACTWSCVPTNRDVWEIGQPILSCGVIAIDLVLLSDVEILRCECLCELRMVHPNIRTDAVDLEPFKQLWK